MDSYYNRASHFTQSSNGNSTYRGTVTSADQNRTSFTSIKNPSSFSNPAHNVGSLGVSYKVYNPSHPNSEDKGSKKRIPLHVQTNSIIPQAGHQRRYSKDSDVLAKAAEVLERSSRGTGADSNQGYQPQKQFSQTTNTFSSSTYSRGGGNHSDVLDKANEILKRSIGYTNKASLSNYEKNYSSNTSQNPLPLPRTPDLVQKSYKGETPMSSYTHASFADKLTPALPGEESKSKTMSILAKVDEALQKSFQITGGGSHFSQSFKSDGRNELNKNYLDVQKFESESLETKKTMSEVQLRTVTGPSEDRKEIILPTKETSSYGGALVIHKKSNSDVIDGNVEKKNQAVLNDPKKSLQEGVQVTKERVQTENLERNMNVQENNQLQNQSREKSQSKVQVAPRRKKPKFAEEFYEDGSVYKGEKVKDWRQGRGELIYSDGSKYEGEWEKDKKNGYGVQTYSNQNVQYDGEWKDDVYHGNGVLMNEDNAAYQRGFDYRDFDTLGSNWIKYEGEFVGGKLQGMGTLTLINNERFVGKFKHGKLNGKGVFYRSDGDPIGGEWENNKFVRIL